MALLVCALLLLAATGVVIGSVLNERQRTRQVSQRLLGQVGRDNKLGSWMRVLGDSSFGRRSVSLDTETQILLNRIGWRKASQRSFYAACQIGMPVLALVIVLVVQNLFFPTFEQGWISLLCALGLGYLLPKRVLASAARRRQEQIAQEVSTFIPLLRILFESGMAVEQALRVLSNEARLLLPQLSAELRLLLARVDSGLELSEELAKTANLLAVDEFNDTCVILQQLIQQGGGAMKSLLSLKQLLDDRRLTRLQEYISKLSAKMSVVMMLFLFPALLIVLAGPGFMAIAKAFSTA